MKQDYSVFILSNGLRMVCWHRNGLVTYIGMVINAGSRDDGHTREGLAHFVEHTIFKGTKKRKSWQISNRMEEVGGELNAYTSKEETMVYTNAPAGYEDRAMELVADIIRDSVFMKEELDREREVIVEEIHSYLDSPAESVYDEFEELAYKGCGLSHNILGSPESVRLIDSQDCRGFIDSFYTPSNMVMYCASALPPEKMVKMAEKYFGSLNFQTAPHHRHTPPPMEIFDEKKEKGNHQANTIVGARVFGRTDPRRFALFLMNNYLGGPGMNSRLNRELREKRGYVYTVESNVGLLSDTGLMIVYFGSDPSTVGKCRSIIANEIDRLCQKKLSAVALEKIKRQYCGQLLVSSDHIENRAMSLGKSLMYFNHIQDISVAAERIRSVTAEEIREVAELLCSDKCSVLTLV